VGWFPLAFEHSKVCTLCDFGHLDFAYSSDYSSFQRGHVISNKNYNNLHVFSFDITSPKIVNFQLSLYFSRFFF
jgi:hypothetical protein